MALSKRDKLLFFVWVETFTRCYKYYRFERLNLSKEKEIREVLISPVEMFVLIYLQLNYTFSCLRTGG